MKVLVYVNEKKDCNKTCVTELINQLNLHAISFDIAYSNAQIISSNYKAIFVIGGDGTILRRTDFANKNNIPIIGVNAGKLGFLSEFEPNNIAEAVQLFAQNKLITDARQTMCVCIDNEEYLALNEVVIQRLYTEDDGMIIEIKLSINDVKVDTITGDGVIVATPTGSTAYSFSAGGAILAPKVNAFIITSLASHSFNQRPIVYSSDQECVAEYVDGASAGLYIDGKYVKTLEKGEKVIINKSKNSTLFLRKNNSSFFKRLYEKIEERGHK